MAKKIISVLTPVHNKAPYIQSWAESLAKQTYLDKMKILVANDGSTDESLNLVEKFSEEYKLPTEIIYNGENIGLMQVTKLLYREIDTPFWCVLDADDYYISPQKIEKAVNFLQNHKDYSGYACNSYFEYPDGNRKIYLKNYSYNQTFEKLAGTPFFQTASTTFVNFFNPNLLDAIDKETEGYKQHAFQGDAFRNVLAFQFGKVYFENSLDVVYRKNIGIWGVESAVSQDIANMNSYFLYFEFLKKNFGVDDNCVACLFESYIRYMKINL